MMKFLFRALIVLLVLGSIVLLAREGYNYPWTGFAGRPVKSEFAPAKTLWDWLDLLIVPVVLAAGALFLEGSRKKVEQEVESDRQRQQTLDDYFAYISELLLDKQLSDPGESRLARELARTRTLTALRLLDGKRKAQVLQFLYEAGLIYSNPIIQLNGADFRYAFLDEAILSRAELRGAYFSGASIRNAILIETDLRGSDFCDVDFHASNLTNARFVQARLDRADLRKARLNDTDLSEVSLDNVKMSHEQRVQFESMSRRRS